MHTCCHRWVVQWPGQVAICVGCMYWTMEMANAITKHSLHDYAEQCTGELMKIVNKVGLGAGQPCLALNSSEM